METQWIPETHVPDVLDLMVDGDSYDFGPAFESDGAPLDMNGQFSLLNRLTYNISVLHELDGMYDELVTVPALAVEKAGSSLWTLMTSGFFHRIRISATEDNQYYHVRFLECTMVYQGQLS